MINIVDSLIEEGIYNNAQHGYDQIVRAFKDYENTDGVRADFIIHTLIQPENGLIVVEKLVDLFGENDGLDYASKFFQLSQNLDSVIGITEFPGYDDYWFSVGFENDGSLSVRIMVGESSHSYVLVDADGTEHSYKEISEIGRTDVEKNLMVSYGDDGSILFSMGQGLPFSYKIKRDDDLPLTQSEFDYLEERLKGVSP